MFRMQNTYLLKSSIIACHASPCAIHFYHTYAYLFWKLLSFHVLEVLNNAQIIFLFMPRQPSWPYTPLSCQGIENELRHTTIGKTPREEWSALRRDPYLKKYNTHKTKAYMSPAGFEPAIIASEQPQAHALHRADSWSAAHKLYFFLYTKKAHVFAVRQNGSEL